MGDMHGMLIMFSIMVGGYLVIVGVYTVYRKIHEWILRRRNKNR